MNKKEFIERLIDVGGCGAGPGSWARGWDDAIGEVLGIAEELDEPQKPVIPQFVADFIESQDDPIYEMCINYEMWGVNGDDGTTTFTGEIAEWFDDNLNVENYYRACIDGYEVEKEKKYYVLDHEGETMLYKVLSQGVAKTSGCKPSEVGKFLSRDYTFTETEIKAVDERYWAFAKPVEEVEE